MVAGSDTIDGDAGDDVIFGDHGVVQQDVPRGRVYAGYSVPMATRDAVFGYATGVASNLQYTFGAGDKLLTAGFIQDLRTAQPDNGATDTIRGNAGRDRIFGGNGGDTIDGGADADVIFGDQGHMSYLGPDYFGITETGLSGLGTLDMVESVDTAARFGGDDRITDDASDDIIFGGQGNDDIDAGAGQNIVFGDHGRILGVDTGVNTPVGDPNPAKTDDDYQVQVLGLITSIDWGAINGAGNDYGNGNDRITTGIGRDIVFGGGGADIINAFASSGGSATADGNNIVFGDHGLVDYLAEEILQNAPLLNPPRTNDIDRIWSIAAATAMGGDDTIATGDRNDIVIGGTGSDTLTTGNGSNIVVGDNAILTGMERDRRATDVLGFSVHEFMLCDIETIGFADADSGNDTITGGSGNDILFGGGGGDTIYAGAGDDLVFGDQGKVECENDVPLDPETSLRPICWDLFPKLANGQPDPSNGFIEFTALNVDKTTGAGDDLIFGEDGSDLIMGQQGRDTLYGGNGDDILIGGSNVAGALDSDDRIDGGAGNDAIAGDNADICFRPDAIDVRMRNLDGIQIYGTSGTSDGGVLIGVTSAANAIDPLHPDVNAARDPRYALRVLVGGVLDKNSGHAQYHIELLDHSDTTPADRYGNDYVAGGAGEDEIFGQLGNDTIQGDGTIGVAIAATPEITARNVGAAQLDLSLALRGGGTYALPAGFTTFGASRGAPGASAAGDLAIGVGDLTVRASFEGANDGDDYIEGGGGNDVIFGNYGQDDIVGGSSDLFGLVVATQDGKAVDPVASAKLRPDGSDIIFGGAGLRIGRNDLGEATTGSTGGTGAPGNDTIVVAAGGHAHDADTIIGDNGRILRLVGVNGAQRDNTTVTGTAVAGTLGTVSSSGGFLNFNYDVQGTATDGYAASTTGAYNRIIVRAVSFLDYTQGGIDYNANAASDRGGNDEIHGEAGDDTIYGMKGHDTLYGDGQDDDIVGGYGNDWISGGTGADGVIGDDGRFIVSRNATTYGEPLYGVLALLPDNGDTKTFNGNMMNEAIATPGSIQQGISNPTAALKKAVNLTPFTQDPNFIGNWDEWTSGTKKTIDIQGLPGAHNADDIIFGGLGDDWLHGASGDDAVSGGEALALAYTQVYAANGTLLGVARSDFNRPYNPAGGDVLRYNPDDPNGWHYDRTRRAGEFALYDEYDPLRKIMLTPGGALNKTDAGGLEWFLNFSPTEGMWAAGGTLNTNGQQTTSYAATYNDGNDRIFGDTGNDWLVGGTGRDDLYGGWGNDLMNADDDHRTNLGRNDLPDTAPSFEDRAYGGAGRDVLIANTGGDRLIDWVGEFNSYLVPFAPFGMATVSRTLQPQLAEFLYTLSASDGADPTRFTDTNGDAALAYRHGEPQGELGVVRQKDFAWQSQTGAPADPQAGNIPGGKRDVLRTANFNDGTTQAFAADSGTWQVSNGTLQVAATSTQADAVAVYQVGDALPSYYEVLAAVQATKPTAGWNANSYVVFDYQSADNFKFAGINVSTNKLEIGQRTAAGGWQVLAQSPMQGGLKNDTWYNLQLNVNGLTATLLVDNGNAFSYTFKATVVDGWSYGLNWGLVGFGSNRSRGAVDNIAVQVVPASATVTRTDDFTSGPGAMLTAVVASSTGTWAAASGGRVTGTPSGSEPALQLLNLSGVTRVAGTSLLDVSTTLRTAGTAGIVFDRYSDTDFKFAAIDVANKQIVIGHRQGNVWKVDASVANTSLASTTDYKLGVKVIDSTVSVTLNDQAAVSFAFNAAAGDGRFGLLARNATASFDIVTVKTNDAAVPAALQASAASVAADEVRVPALAADDAIALLGEAARRWALVEDAINLHRLQGLRIEVADLEGDNLAEYADGVITVDVDAAGHGWFVDATPASDAEFAGSGELLAALPDGGAAGRIDLLSVLAHEMGHAIGLGHSDSGVMAAELQAGERTTPEMWGQRAATDQAPTTSHGITPPVRLDRTDSGTAAAALPRADERTVPQTEDRRAAIEQALAMTSGALPVQIDWTTGLRMATSQPGPDEASPKAVVPKITVPKAADTTASWQRRFVNHLGASVETMQPNAALRLHLPAAAEGVHRLGRL